MLGLDIDKWLTVVVSIINAGLQNRPTKMLMKFNWDYPQQEHEMLMPDFSWPFTISIHKIFAVLIQKSFQLPWQISDILNVKLNFNLLEIMMDIVIEIFI